MSDDRHDVTGYPAASDEARAISALRRLPRAGADPEVRGRARQAFLAEPPVPMPARSRPHIWSAGGLAAATTALAALLAVFIIGRMPTEQWVVLDVVNPAGVEAPAGSGLQKGALLEPGVVACAEGTELEVQLGERLRFRMMPGTRLELPAGPGRWFGRHRELKVAAGEIFGTTGGNKLGFPLEFQTRELTAHLTGTTFAVFRTDQGSCVCLWEGGITVTPTAETQAPTVLEPQSRVWVYRDGRPAEVLPLTDMEIMKLQMTADMGLAHTPR